MSASASHQSASTIEAAPAGAPAASVDTPRPQGGLGIFRLVTTVITLILGGGVFSLAGDEAANGASGAAILTDIKVDTGNIHRDRIRLTSCS